MEAYFCGYLKHLTLCKMILSPITGGMSAWLEGTGSSAVPHARIGDLADSDVELVANQQFCQYKALQDRDVSSQIINPHHQ